MQQNAVTVFREIKSIRRSRDLSFFEDADLNRLKYESLSALIKHLLAGHHGRPCPAGPRPIVSPRPNLDRLYPLAFAPSLRSY